MSRGKKEKRKETNGTENAARPDREAEPRRDNAQQRKSPRGLPGRRRGRLSGGRADARQDAAQQQAGCRLLNGVASKMYLSDLIRAGVVMLIISDRGEVF